MAIDLGAVAFVPSDDGRWIDANFARLAEVVQDYDPQYELRWVPPEHRNTDLDNSYPYVVWDVVGNYAAIFVKETDTPVDVLTRLFESDNKFGSVLERLEAHNKAVELLELKKQMDAAEERQEYLRWLVETKKNYITLPGGKKVDDQLRPRL